MSAHESDRYLQWNRLSRQIQLPTQLPLAKLRRPDGFTRPPPNLTTWSRVFQVPLANPEQTVLFTPDTLRSAPTLPICLWQDHTDGLTGDMSRLLEGSEHGRLLFLSYVDLETSRKTLAEHLKSHGYQGRTDTFFQPYGDIFVIVGNREGQPLLTLYSDILSQNPDLAGDMGLLV